MGEHSNRNFVRTEYVNAEVPIFASRENLPAKMLSKDQISVWSIIKNSIGKDLSRISVPIQLNEPLSLLQRLAENMQFSHLILKAAECDDMIDRLEIVGSFAASTLSSIRLAKPFNPVLFESFELDRPDLGFKFVAEQVSHHPPISAFHVTADDYEFYGTIAPKMKFYGRSISVDPHAHFTLRFTKLDETYVWQALQCVIRNIIIGEMYMSLSGTLTVKQFLNNNHESANQFRLTYKDAGNSGAELLVTGELISGKNKIRSVFGNWMTYIASCDVHNFSEHYHAFEKEFRRWSDNRLESSPLVLISDSRVMWRSFKKPATANENYDFTFYALMLNELPDDVANMPKTDSRLRPDIREMERGNFDIASEQKERIEDKQRETRKCEKKAKVVKFPKWFYSTLKKDEFGRDGQWRFNGTYWKREFQDCEDIF